MDKLLNRAAPGFIFALTPATGQPDLPLDLLTQEGQNIHRKVAEGFAEKFDGDADNEMMFVSNTIETVSAAGWDRTTIGMLEVPIGVPFVTDAVDCVSEYGRVMMNDIRNHAVNYVGTPTRVAQNSCHINKSLMVSITPDLHKRILADLDQAKVNGV